MDTLRWRDASPNALQLNQKNKLAIYFVSPSKVILMTQLVLGLMQEGRREGKEGKPVLTSLRNAKPVRGRDPGLGNLGGISGGEI